MSIVFDNRFSLTESASYTALGLMALQRSAEVIEDFAPKIYRLDPHKFQAIQSIKSVAPILALASLPSQLSEMQKAQESGDFISHFVSTCAAGNLLINIALGAAQVCAPELMPILFVCQMTTGMVGFIADVFSLIESVSSQRPADQIVLQGFLFLLFNAGRDERFNLRQLVSGDMRAPPLLSNGLMAMQSAKSDFFDISVSTKSLFTLLSSARLHFQKITVVEGYPFNLPEVEALARACPQDFFLLVDHIGKKGSKLANVSVIQSADWAELRSHHLVDRFYCLISEEHPLIVDAVNADNNIETRFASLSENGFLFFIYPFNNQESNSRIWQILTKVPFENRKPFRFEGLSPFQCLPNKANSRLVPYYGLAITPDKVLQEHAQCFTDKEKFQAQILKAKQSGKSVIVEVGCGRTCIEIREKAAQYPQCEFFGIDPSLDWVDEMLFIPKNISLFRGRSDEALKGLEDNIVDRIVIVAPNQLVNDSIGWDGRIPDDNRYLTIHAADIPLYHKILKPGGTVTIITENLDWASALAGRMQRHLFNTRFRIYTDNNVEDSKKVLKITRWMSPISYPFEPLVRGRPRGLLGYATGIFNDQKIPVYRRDLAPKSIYPLSFQTTFDQRSIVYGVIASKKM